MSNTHNDVCHAWANKTGKHRKGFNMFYDGDTIYSYGSHFPIARHVTAPNGHQVVLFTTQSYSISTSRHKTFTRRACNHLEVLDVADVNAPQAHEANWEAMVKGAKDNLDKAKRARSRARWLMDSALDLIAQANKYRTIFGLDKPVISAETLEPTVNEMMQAAKVREELDRVRREAAERERLREARKTGKPLLRAWLQGDNVRPGYNHRFGTARPLVRVKGDVVETTWGASVPLDVALCVFRLASKVRRNGKGWEATGLKQFKVGDFALNSIGPTGNIVVGCHNIPYRFAKLAADLAGISIAA